MGTPRFTPEFKEEAVRQITERGYSVLMFLTGWAFQHTVSINGYGRLNLITASSMPGIYWRLKARS